MPRKCLNPTFIYFPTMWPHPKLHFRVVLTVASVDNCKEVNYQSKPFLQKWPWGQWGQKRSSKVRLFFLQIRKLPNANIGGQNILFRGQKVNLWGQLWVNLFYKSDLEVSEVKWGQTFILNFFYKSENFSNTKSNTGGQNILFRGQNVKLWGQLWVKLFFKSDLEVNEV